MGTEELNSVCAHLPPQLWAKYPNTIKREVKIDICMRIIIITVIKDAHIQRYAPSSPVVSGPQLNIQSPKHQHLLLT